MNIINFLDLFGTAVFAISGSLAAARKEMDITGILLVGVIVGIGGGTIRDVLLNRTVFWFHNPMMIYLGLISSLVVILFSKKFYFSERLLLIPDALGLGVFSVVGTQITLQQQLPWDVAVIMGVLTAVGGGVIRDILCNEIPLVLKREIYATAALLGSLCFLILQNYINNRFAGGIAIALVIIIRLIAIEFNLGLPVITADWFVKKRE